MRRKDGGRRCGREEKAGDQGGERRSALRRDRKRDSLGLVIYSKRSRAPRATRTRTKVYHVPAGFDRKCGKKIVAMTTKTIFGKERKLKAERTQDATVRDGCCREVHDVPLCTIFNTISIE